MTEFTHHVRAELWEFDPTRNYEQRGHMKPRGLWLSVDGDWERWLTDEDWGEYWLQHPAVSFELETDKCLWLTTPEELDVFTLEYTSEEMKVISPDYYRSIEWKRVTEKYSGIIISPYMWARRMDGIATGWYYPWDCASACIWDLSVLRVKESSGTARQVSEQDREVRSS